MPPPSTNIFVGESSNYYIPARRGRNMSDNTDMKKKKKTEEEMVDTFYVPHDEDDALWDCY